MRYQSDMNSHGNDESMIRIKEGHSIQKEKKAHDAPFFLNPIFSNITRLSFYATRVDSTARANDLLLSRLFSAVRNVSLDKSDR